MKDELTGDIFDSAAQELVELIPEHDYEPLTMDLVEEKAKQGGFDMVRADDFTLLLDLDSEDAMRGLPERIGILSQWIIIDDHETWRSKSGNWHVRLHMTEPLPMPTRYAIQAALGSDGKRELLHLRDLAEGIIEPCCLFRPKGAETAPQT